MLIVAGIDYSMTSPAICVHQGDTWDPSRCRFFFRTDKAKLLINTDLLSSKIIKPWKCNEERFVASAEWAGEVLVQNMVHAVAIEGYAMGAKGLVFHIGENTGQLKRRVWEIGLPFIVPPPTVIKKFATGKGNAKKEAMIAQFEAETGIFFRALLGQTDASLSPTNDLADAYYMAKWAFSEATTGSLQRALKP